MGHQSFYAIQGCDDSWYRTYTHNSKRSSGWVLKLEDAKIWTKRSQAQGILTRLANENNGEAPPKLVEFVVGSINIIDETERIAKAKEAKEAKKAQEQARIQKLRIECAERELNEAKKRLAALQR